MTNTNTALQVGDKIKITAGTRARGIDKGTTAQVRAITPLGAEFSHTVRVTFVMLNGFKSGQVFSFYARHENRLSDAVINLNDGNPSHKIQIVRASR